MKLIIGILIGVAMTCSIFFGPLTGTSASDQTGEVYESASPDENMDLDEKGVFDVLKLSETEIDDKHIAEYYQLLMEQYDLVDDIKVSNDLNPLPDINKIVRLATSLPLQEAGKNIQDEDISHFYHDLLEDVGWEFD